MKIRSCRRTNDLEVHQVTRVRSEREEEEEVINIFSFANDTLHDALREVTEE